MLERLSPVVGICILTGVGIFALAQQVGPGPTGVLAAEDTCDPGRPHAPGNLNETIVSGALTRDYILHVPPSYTGADRIPLVLNLHGAGSFASDQKLYSDLAAKADEAGFVLVMPQAIGVSPGFERRWHVTTVFPGAPDDVGFITDLLDEIEAALCVDPARVYSTGISNGAQMSMRLACNLSDRIAAIAPVAGVYWPPFSPDFAEPADCPAKTRPVPVIAFHGTDDLFVPFNGGLGILGTTFRLSIEDAIAEWAANDNCTTGPSDSQAAPGVRLRHYEDCDDGAAVDLYVVEDADGAGPGTEGGGHTWPGTPIDVPGLGATSHEISANDLMWAFFQAHPLALGPKPPPVGGVAELPDVANTAPQQAPGLSSGSRGLLAIIGAVAAGTLALTGAAWYTRRRWLA